MAIGSGRLTLPDFPRSTEDDDSIRPPARGVGDPLASDRVRPARDGAGARRTGAASPRELLTRLSEDRSLRLSASCRKRLAERAILLDPMRLEARAMACVAHRAPRYAGRPSLGTWVGHRIDEAIDALLLEDWEEVQRGELPCQPRDPRYSRIADALGLDAVEARRVCTLLNGLDEKARQALYAAVVGGR